MTAPNPDPGPLPECPQGREDCAFAVLTCGGDAASRLAWGPVYNRQGALIGRDPTTYRETIECWTCSRAWLRTRREGMSELVELTVHDGG